MVGDSISILAYKQPDYLRRSIQSVVIQDYEDYEVTITDDSSDDSIRDIVAAVDITAPITYVKNAERLGAPKNWNMQ